jgi:hypothetical protein
MAFTARAETYFSAASLADPYAITLDKPANTANGDILFCFIAWGDYSGQVISNIPEGWSQIAISSTSYACRFSLYYKIANNEGGSWTWYAPASAKTLAVCSCYTSGDFDPADPIDVVSNGYYRTSSYWAKAESMTVSAVNSPLVFWCGFSSTYNCQFTKPELPTTDWVEDFDYGDTDCDIWIEVCSMLWAGSGATGSMDAYDSRNVAIKQAFAVALNPAPAGWANIAKVNGIASSSIAKVNGIAVADIAKINGVAV